MEYSSEEMDIGLEALVKGASEAMLTKLQFRYVDGYHGWDNINLIQELWDKLEDHIDKGLDRENMVDIMNLAAFLWNMADAAKRLHLLPETRKEQYSDAEECPNGKEPDC